jgi:hypothetical protein
MTRATPATSSQLGIWVRTSTPMTTAVAGSRASIRAKVALGMRAIAS